MSLTMRLSRSQGVVWDMDENRLFLNGLEVQEECLVPLSSCELSGELKDVLEVMKMQLVSFFQQLMVVRLYEEEVIISVDLTKVKSLCKAKNSELVGLVEQLVKRKVWTGK